MGLLNDLNVPSQPLGNCKVRSIAANLDEDDAKVLLAAVMDPAWKVHVLANELTKRGIAIGSNTLNKHRNGTCSCSKI